MLRTVLAGATALTALAAGITVSATAAEATSCPIDRLCVTTYYNNAAHSTVIGTAGWRCGVFFQSGSTSFFWTKITTTCD